ncbi:MAG: SDR family NAD(P)-dependent oxidoreductase [Actinomycetota bacterium]|nr:SDR family NAD(P)-dependent oxidoreductase [Actinomycetota bacterium]
MINNASLFSIVPMGYTNAYTATKQAVAGFTGALRQELMPAKNIHIVKIRPAGGRHANPSQQAATTPAEGSGPFTPSSLSSE